VSSGELNEQYHGHNVFPVQTFKMFKVIFTTLSLLAIYGCSSNKCDWSNDLTNISKKPDSTQLYGVYKPDDRTLKTIPGYSNLKDAEIILEADDKLTVKNIPVSTFDFVNYNKNVHQPVNGNGRWRAFYDKYAAVSVAIHLDSNLVGSVGTHYRLFQKNGKYLIALPLGHPDDCVVARFIHQ